MVLGTAKRNEWRMGALSKKNKKSWFEMLCTMDATDTREGDRTRVRSNAAGPYGRDEDIPPFGFAFFTVYQSSNFTIGGKK